jgi:site-specific recombinase XerD
MTEIRTSDVRAYTEARLKEGATPAGVNRELSVIKRMFRSR